MTTQHTASAVRPGGRIRALLALDGPVAMTALTVFHYFLASASFVACLLPAIAFEMIVGWQATHVAIWLGAASLLPILPAMYALLRAARRLLDDRADARAGRVFWSAFARGCRSLWWAALGAALLVAVLAYDIALLGLSDAMLVFVFAVGALLVTLAVAVAVAAAAGVEARPLTLLTAAFRVVARRPHVALAWLLLIALGAGAVLVPVVGATAGLFGPALVAVAIHICNDSLHLPLIDRKKRPA